MSTLPFLLSVADELDNINSQSYMDDFGLGFYPHRTAFHRTPTIQLSLPAGTDWMSTTPDGRHSSHSRYRSHRYYLPEPTQSNLQEEEDQYGEGNGGSGVGGGGAGESKHDDADDDDDDNYDHYRRRSDPDDGRCSSAAAAAAAVADADSNNLGASTSSAAAAAAAQAAHKYTLALNSNNVIVNDNLNKGPGSIGGGSSSVMGVKVRSVSGSSALSGALDDDDENIDTTVRMYNLSKKCCKNYYRHALETGPGAKGAMKCATESTNSSSEESLQKVSSPIEFLTCFLIKKSRTPKTSSGLCGGSSKKS